MEIAPDFTLDDFTGQPVSLSDYKNYKHVILVFNRGFFWPFCRRHMAQLRLDYLKFSARDAEILVVGPDGREAFKHYWEKHDLPFVGLPDPKHQVANLYGQQVNLLALGRMPAILVIDKEGYIRYRHYGDSMRDIPLNFDILRLIDKINQPN